MLDTVDAEPLYHMPFELVWQILPRQCGDLGFARITTDTRMARRQRRYQDRFRKSLVVVEGDGHLPLGALGPAAFNSGMLAWALRNAALVVVWAAGWEVPGKVPEKVRTTLESGQKVTLLAIRPEHAPLWLALVEDAPSVGETLIIAPWPRRA